MSAIISTLLLRPKIELSKLNDSILIFFCGLSFNYSIIIMGLMFLGPFVLMPTAVSHKREMCCQPLKLCMLVRGCLFHSK